MGQAITDAMGISLNDVAQYDRSPIREAREPGSIGFSVTAWRYRWRAHRDVRYRGRAPGDYTRQQP